MVDAHAVGGLFQGLALYRGDAGQGQLQAGTIEDQVIDGLGLDTVETLGELHQRRVTALAHGLDDVEHTLVDRVVGHAFPAQQMIQMSGEIRIGSVESANCSGSGHSEGLIDWRMHKRTSWVLHDSGTARLPGHPRGHLSMLGMTRIDGRGSGPRM